MRASDRVTGAGGAHAAHPRSRPDGRTPTSATQHGAAHRRQTPRERQRDVEKPDRPSKQKSTRWEDLSYRKDEQTVTEWPCDSVNCTVSARKQE